MAWRDNVIAKTCDYQNAQSHPTTYSSIYYTRLNQTESLTFSVEQVVLITVKSPA